MQSPKVHSLELNWGSHNLIESSCPSDYSTFSWPLPSTCCCDYSHTMPNSPDITLLDSNFSPPSAYCPIYLSLPFSRKQTLLSVVDTSQQITCQTTDDLTLSLPPDYILLLDYGSHTHTPWFGSSKCIKIIALKLRFYLNVKVQTLPKT